MFDIDSHHSQQHFFNLQDAQAQALAELLAQQQHMSQGSSLPLQQLPYPGTLEGIASSSSSYPGLALYSIDSQSAPMPFLNRGGFQQPLQQLPGMPVWDGSANIPLLSSSSSSEPNQHQSLATSTPSLLPDAPLLQLGSRSYTPDVPPPMAGPTAQEGALAVDEKSLLSTLQQLSMLGLDETGRPGRTRLNLPQMPADVWQGGVQMQAPWAEEVPASASTPPQTSSA